MSYPICETAPFRADVVGSYLRPDQLKNARNLHRQGLLDDAGLKQVEDECIRDLIAQQIKHGLRGITDGEFRRSWWHLDFMWGLGGIKRVQTKQGFHFVGLDTRAETAALEGKLSGKNHPFVEHFKFVKQFESNGYGLQARQTVPAPAQTLSNLLKVRNSGEDLGNWRDYYATEEDLAEALGAVYREVFADLYAAGCHSIQIDDCSWPALCDPDLVAKNQLDVKRLAELYLLANNACLKDKPKDLAICTHICRGNYRSHYFSKGSYDQVANVVFAHENVDGFYLEYDDERSGSFEALQQIPHDKRVVLGIVTSKRPELEDLKALEARVRQAAQYFPLENLCVSPQCGFASTEEGNELTAEQQWAKVDLVVELARRIWG
ncbi:MAG TPA: 5-methyltetrahydropteroyltriglutamate--homocysteine S-methyltransferase [Candidatus Anaerobiospirillum stercoravium]|nr:5-methyltetrahydropteroyltriglutamate--homocysteine S-methyltransferase [Candidatus Anaerobiospirillum stercoravium]